MAGTLKLGSIPPLSVWQDEVFTFNVLTGLGPGAKFSMRAAPIPAGEMTLDPTSGFFKFAPTAEDRQEISIWIRAQKEKNEEIQKFVITPHPRLMPEFKFIRHLADVPDTASQLYVTYSEQDGGKAVFNNTADYEDEDVEKVKIDTKIVSVSGIRIVLEANSGIHPLFNMLDDKTNLQGVTICADELVLRSPLRLPGTDLFIYARRLVFEGDGKTGGSIDTTPRSVMQRAQKRDEGLKGQRAGAVHLYASKIEMPGNDVRIRANGGNGQGARLGLAGKPGDSVEEWNGEAITVNFYAANETMNWKWDYSPLEGYAPVYAEIWRYYLGGFNAYTKEFDIGTKKFPTNGADPELLPGQPGRGGDSGAISVGEFSWIENRYVHETGNEGAMAKDIEAAPAGTPRKWCFVRAEYQMFIVPAFEAQRGGEGVLNRRLPIKFLQENGVAQKHETKDGKPAPAPGPNPNTLPGQEGKTIALAKDNPLFWLHKASVRALIPYFHDAMLAGHAQTPEVRDLLITYRDATALAAKDTPANKNDPETLEWATLNSELGGLLQRMDSPYDYYGNPAGWVPMLSFQTNLTLFQTETEDALRLLFLSYWIEKTKNKERKATETIKAAIEGMGKETEQALKDFEAANSRLASLDLQAKNIQNKITTLKDSITAFETDLKRLVANDIQREKLLRGGIKILGGIMQLVPVGQPILGAFGKAGVALSDIDLDKPTMSVLPGVLKAFAPIAQEKASKAFKNLLDKSKEGKKKVKENAEKAKFDKAVARAELKADVKSHLKEKDEIKDEIVDTFHSMAVKDSEVEERLAQVAADCPELQSRIAQLKDLNKSKALFAEQLLAAIQTADEASTVILTNQLATISLRAERDELLSKLSNGVLQFAQGMGDRARLRLMKYQYYLLQSYQYLMLSDTSGIDFRTIKLFNQFATILDKSDDGTLTSEQLKALKSAYESQVKEDIQKIIEAYQGSAPSLTGEFELSLTPDEIKSLNESSDNRIELDLMRRGGLELGQENMRITKVEAKTVELATPPERGAITVNLEYFHEGTSRLRRHGQLFLFRSGDYSVAPGAGAGNDGRGGHRAHRLWGTNIGYEEGKQTVKSMIPDPAAGSLLRYLIGASDHDRSKESSLYFRPGAWSELRLRLSTSPSNANGSLKKLTLQIGYVSDALPDELASVLVRSVDDVEPLVNCSVIDMNGCRDGVGAFLRTFNRNISPTITLSVAPRYGGRNFLNWRVVGKAGKPDKLVNNPSLELDLRNTSTYTVEPIYAKEITPAVTEQPKPWPNCPDGWISSDWIFKNESKDTIRIGRIDSNLASNVSKANVATGDDNVRLSFDRLTLGPHESAQITFCANPKGPGSAGAPVHISFYFLTFERNYTVHFSGKGEVQALRKNNDFEIAENEVLLDVENRILTFKP